MTNPDSQIRRYKRLGYTRTIELREIEGGEAYYLASIEELPGVEASGDTRHGALYHLSEAFESYLRAMIQLSHEIPEPEPWPATYPGERHVSKPGGTAASVGESTGGQDDWRPEGSQAEPIDQELELDLIEA